MVVHGILFQRDKSGSSSVHLMHCRFQKMMKDLNVLLSLVKNLAMIEVKNNRAESQITSR